MSSDSLDIERVIQTVFSFHCGTRCIKPNLLNQRKNELPAKAFQAVVRGYGQLITTAGAAALQNIASISSGHAFAKAVNTDTTSDFRLISAFGSHFSIFSFQFPDRLQSGFFTENCLLGFRLPRFQSFGLLPKNTPKNRIHEASIK